MADTTFFALLWVALLILLNGTFVAAEFAMVRSHPTRLKSAEMKRKFGVKWALRLLSDLDVSLSTTQLGITFASLILGWWGEHTFQHIFFEIFAFFGEPLRTVASHGVATTLALLVITFLHVVLGELCAKSLAIRYPETTLRMIAGPMLLIHILCLPVVAFLSRAANLFLRLCGVKTPAESERAHTSAELAMLVSQSTERGILDKDEEQMLHGVFTFSDTVAREVMTPRADMVTIGATSSFDEVIATITQARFSRYPVVGEGVDNVLGILMMRDLLPHMNKVRVTGDISDFDVRKIMREPFFVPDTKKIDDLLNEFKKRKMHLAVVVDEHGGVDGIVTLEDLIEEIVGDIFDESDVPEKDIVVEKDGNILVDGGVLVADINNRFELGIPEGDYDTIAGFIYASLGRIPRVGDQISVPVNGAEGGVGVIGEGSGGQVGGPATQGAADMLADPGAGATASSNVRVPPAAVIVVELVKGRRIERVRLNPAKGRKNKKPPESVGIDPSSLPKSPL